ncbi:MAG: NADH-quinone oxidoreductase subunit M [Elusimicrobiota bacterium]
MPLSMILFTPVLASFLIIFIKNTTIVKYLSFSVTVFNLIISVLMYFNFQTGLINFEENVEWINALNIRYHVGVDSLSLLMILLTNFAMAVSLLSSFSYIKKDIKKYYIWFLILLSATNGVFMAQDVFLFYLFWEAMLIPMYFIIGMWGGKNRVYATTKFFIYTMSASLIMLVGIIIIYINLKKSGINSFDIIDFYKNNLTGKTQLFVFFSFLIAFSVKVPLFPFHTWLPDAHVEAPTAGSVMLAGVLLKMGVYGYLRFLIPMFPELSKLYAPYIALFGVIGIIYASLMAFVQKDIKKLIAYSSIAHMGLVVLGIFSFESKALSGAILQMVNHGISTGGLFLIVGILYERTHTRIIDDYGGIFKVVPYLSTFFMVIMLSSIAFPSTNGFIGEIIIFIGSFNRYPLLTLFSLLGVVLGAVYMLKAYEKMFFGMIKDSNKKIFDINLIEWLYLSGIVILIFWIGIYPKPFLNFINIFLDFYRNLGVYR